MIQFSSWGLIQPLDLESPCSEHEECIKLLRTFRWRGVKSLFYLICGKNLTPDGLSKDKPVLVMSLLPAGPGSACPSHHLCVPAQEGEASCGTTVILALWSDGKGSPASPFDMSFICTSERWKFTFHWVTLQQPPKLEQLPCTNPSELRSCSWIWNIRGKWADRSEI